jgi:hypothetical protein
MKKNLLLLILIVFVYSSSFSQEGLLQFTKSYFRSNPFVGEFSGFLNHLMNDPDLKEKKTFRRTDTSLFYFSGIYRNYNPFFFKPRQIMITLEETPAQFSDSSYADTIFVYHLLAYADGTEKGQQDIKREFDKIHRQFNKKFSSSNFQDLQKDTSILGGAHNYFINYTDIAPVSVAWGKVKDDFVLNLVLRLKTSNNRAALPATFNNP